MLTSSAKAEPVDQTCDKQKFAAHVAGHFSAQRFVKPLCEIVTLLALASTLYPQTRTPRKTRMARAAARPAGETRAAAASPLPIRRVVLYSNGVAYFERRGTVSGHTEINLPFKQSQVDDVLKSMLVLDLGHGRIGAVSYNSSAPPSARLAEIPFSIEPATGAEADGGLAGVLKQLQGARVVVNAAGRELSGSILTVEERKSQIDANKPPLVTQALVIAAENGEIASFDLASVRSVRLLDEGARHDLTGFTEASAAGRRRDAKTIVVTSDGGASREMMVSYTVAAPIWKTTYRVVLDQAGKPFFQGWAIIDNVGDEDWNEVALSLVSGTPVSFIQPIQQPMYRYRPVVPVPQDLRLSPQTYEAEESEGVLQGAAGYVVNGARSAPSPSTLHAAPGMIDESAGKGPGAGGGMGFGPGVRAHKTPAPPPPPLTKPEPALSDAIRSDDSGVTAAASGAEVGDLFEYRIDQPMTVRRDRSALIPILQTQMEGERVSIYNESARRDRPMSGLRLKNTSPLTLEGGSMTVIDVDAYAGEALMERLKPNEERFISFALDLGTLVNARTKSERRPAFLVRVVNGVFQSHYYQNQTKTYTITNQTDKPRAVYVEHPVRNGWKLSGDLKPSETTASFYRFRVDLKPRATVELPVTERLAMMDTYEVSNVTSKDIELFVARGYIDDATRKALEKIMEIKAKIASVEARSEALDREVNEISADQARLRENIKAMGDKAEAKPLVARYVAKAGEQETRLEQIAAERRAAASERATLQAELDAAIRALALDRKLQGD